MKKATERLFGMGHQHAYGPRLGGGLEKAKEKSAGGERVKKHVSEKRTRPGEGTRKR